MSYAFAEGRQYLMPTHFGPMSGPRHTAEGGTFLQPDQREITIYSAPFRTEHAAIEQHLPPGFELAADPVVTVSMIFMTGIAWLAGRGYNTLGVTVPVRFRGERDVAEGPLQLVLWETLPEAILTGRDQLGFSKIHCSIPEPLSAGNEVKLEASWEGHRFCELAISDLKQSAPSAESPAPAAALTGILNYRYLPSIDDSSRPALAEATLVPFLRNTPDRVLLRQEGNARLRFLPTRWEDMPTQFRIVEGLRALPILEMLPATVIAGIGACDARDQKALR